MKIGDLIIGSKIGQIVRNGNTLKAMAKLGHFAYPITSGQPYVDEKDNPRSFEYKGNKYSIEYKSGCFYPFVVAE